MRRHPVPARAIAGLVLLAGLAVLQPAFAKPRAARAPVVTLPLDALWKGYVHQELGPIVAQPAQILKT
jgi:hypothetical protein